VQRRRWKAFFEKWRVGRDFALVLVLVAMSGG
jgi:hypothetical protein